MSKILFVVGEPGVGKSTLVTEAFAPFERAAVDHRAAGGPMRELLWRGADLIGCELGRRIGTPAPVFPGTDAMSQTAIVGVDAWLCDGADRLGLIVLEGTRLANKRFVNAAVAGGHQLQLFYLYGPPEASQRRRERGTEQDPRWVKGRQTAARNFYDLCDRMRNQFPDQIATHVLPAKRPVEDNARFMLAMGGLVAPVSR